MISRARWLAWSVTALIFCCDPAGDLRGAADRPVDRAIDRVRPALVRIRVVWTEDYQGREIKREASGSGVIISRDGEVITNHHVAGRATRIVCVLASNEELEATLLGTDALADIAVLRLRATPGRVFPFAAFGDSSRVKVGDEVLAMGSPLALSQSVTRGIISNTKMVMPGSYRAFDEFVMDGEPVGAMVRWLGHDAAIFPGNSGGPLVNLDGDVIGINEISFGLGGAIPADLARHVARQIIENGRVRRSWLGIEFQPLLKDGPSRLGALVRGVVSASPAAKAGLRSGDILLRLAGRETTVRFDEEIPLLNQQVAALPIGKPVPALVARGDTRLTLTLTPIEREPAMPPAEELKEWGVTTRNLSLLAVKELKLESREGVAVTSVRPGGPSGRAKPPLQPGDVIVRVDDRPIHDLAALRAVTSQRLAGGPAVVPVLVRFRRGPQQLVTVVPVGLPARDTPARDARKAWLPVALQVITRDLAKQLGDPNLTGVRLTQVYPQTAADRAGLKVDDLIVTLDGEPLTGTEPGDEGSFLNRIRQYRVGARPEFGVRRGSVVLKIAVELERTPLAEREMTKYEDQNFEFTARDVSFFDRVQEEWSPDRAGALVTEVEDGGWAALGGLRVNDLIEAIDAVPVTDVAGLEARMKAVATRKPRYVILRILRGIHTYYLQLETTWNH